MDEIKKEKESNGEWNFLRFNLYIFIFKKIFTIKGLSPV